jgi:hypothetical protein
MTGPERDPEFEDFLRRRSPMYRRLSDFDHAEPSDELDRLVLSRAREAIETPAQPPIYRATRWAMPVGLAATILLAFTVLLNVGRHEAAGQKQAASTVSPAADDPPADSAAPAESAAPIVAAEGSADVARAARKEVPANAEGTLAASGPEQLLSARSVASSAAIRVAPAAPAPADHRGDG